jgi:mRNA interferase RelE/StbE
MAWNLQLAGPAQKDFKKLPAKDQERVRKSLLAMQEDAFHGDVQRLKGQPNAWRGRVGNYRIIYDLNLETREIVVSGILRRSSTTY